MGEKGNFPGGSTATSGLPKVGHPTAAKEAGGGMAAKEAAAGLAAKDPGLPTATKDLGAAPPPPPANGAPAPHGLPGMGGFLAGREDRRDDDPPVAGA
jgi:hypothetical protein